MSVVAVRVYDDKIEIAADSISVRGYTQTKNLNSHSKLAFVNNMYIGSCGSAEESSLLQVYCSTRKPEQASKMSLITFFSEFSDWKNTKIGTGGVSNVYIVVFEGKAFLVEHFFVEEILSYESIGAGMDYALAALHLGHTVDRAVEVATELSVYCEAPVTKFVVEK